MKETCVCLITADVYLGMFMVGHVKPVVDALIWDVNIIRISQWLENIQTC